MLAIFARLGWMLKHQTPCAGGVVVPPLPRTLRPGGYVESPRDPDGTLDLSKLTDTQLAHLVSVKLDRYMQLRHSGAPSPLVQDAKSFIVRAVAALPT